MRGALIDGGPNALVSGSLNSNVQGRYVFNVRAGQVLPPPTTSTVPEPTTVVLLGSGGLALVGVARRRNRTLTLPVRSTPRTEGRRQHLTTALRACAAAAVRSA